MCTAIVFFIKPFVLSNVLVAVVCGGLLKLRSFKFFFVLFDWLEKQNHFVSSLYFSFKRDRSTWHN